MKGRLIPFAGLFLSTIIHAARVAPPLIETQRGETPIELQNLNVDIDISGSIAETKIQMVFFNPNQRNLEGTLHFPLLDGQQIIGFALDINGTLRPAVTVEKTRGREIFEDIERRSADPALLEKTQGNNFKLRVYPINAHGTRTVEITYHELLIQRDQDLTYRLPLGQIGQPSSADFNVNIHGLHYAPRMTGVSGEVHFVESHGDYSVHMTAEDTRFQNDLTVMIPANKQPSTFVHQFAGSNYFVTEIPVSNVRTPRELPKTVGLLWDASGSGSNRPIETEFLLLDKYFTSLRNVEVRLTRLRDRHESTLRFQVINGDWEALRKELQSTIYDGATNLSDWTPQTDVNEYVLVSDGLSNYGNTPFPQLSAKQKLFVISSLPGADNNRLAALAERNRGWLVRVSSDNPDAAATELLTARMQVKEISSTGIEEIVADPTTSFGYLRIAGKLTNQTGQLNLTIIEQNLPRTINVTINTDTPTSPFTPFLWASYKLHQLDGDYELNRGAIRRIGTLFSIPTRETSLLVLDTVEDYVQYKIAPPPELKVQYDRLKNNQAADLRRSRSKQMAEVVRQFEQKVKWWNTDYPKEDPSIPTNKYKGNSPGVTYVMPPGTPPPPVEVAIAAPDVALSSISVQANRRPRDTNVVVDAITAEDIGKFPDSNIAGSLNRISGVSAPKEYSAGVNGDPVVGITLKRWSSDAPYMARLKKASKKDVYRIYLDEKPSYQNSSAFFLDVSDILFEKGLNDLGLRVLSNLAEMDLENAHVLRILGYRLLQANNPKLSIPIFEKVLLLAENEPQSFRDLGLAYAANNKYQQSVDHLNEVIQRPWDDRFAEIELIVIAEMNAVIAEANQKLVPVNTSKVDPRLLKNLPLDVRAVLTWDADDSDMDLWVTDPNNERCFYGHNSTYQGGRMSRDFTNGYGPEEFSLRTAKPGVYKIEANFFGDRQQLVTSAVTLQVALTTAFGTVNAKQQRITLRLKDKGDTIFIGEFEVK